MPTTTILWTALPRGVRVDDRGRTHLELSILVSPRLDTGGAPHLPLASFPAFVDWPAQPLAINLRFSGRASFTAVPSPSPADSGLWRALFPAERTTVRSFEPADFSQRRIRSFPVVHVVDYLRSLYAAVGVASPEELPLIAELAARCIDICTVSRGPESGWLSLEEMLGNALRSKFRESGSWALPPAEPNPALDFYTASLFHRFRASAGQYDKLPKPPVPDFHEALALLGDHPFLLRRLGLILDVSVPFSGQPPSGTVRVDQLRHEFASEDRPLATRYLLDVREGRFTAAPGPGSDLEHGMLRLGSGGYCLQQIDVDGAALKAVQFANQLLMRLLGRLASIDSAGDDGLPALRCGGISVVRTGRAVQMSQAFSAVAAKNAAIEPANFDPQKPPELVADEVTRGYRLDVEDAEEAGVWRSLCRRDATYRVGRLEGTQATIEASDASVDERSREGIVTATVKQDVDPAKKDLFLHEALFHWDGWSLVAPRPGEAIQPDGLTHDERLDNPSQSSLQLEITTRPAAASLPRLRFGHTYRLRARAVDVAGNSLPLSSPDASQASAPLTYRRFEPVEAPAVVIVSEKAVEELHGESAARLVIRSYDPAIPGSETSERLLLPPRTAVAMIEQYGLLDAAAGFDGSAATWQRLAELDETEFPGPKSGDQPETIRYVEPDEIPPQVPYPADPFAVGAVLRGLPAAAGSIEVAFLDGESDWWQAKPFRIAVVEGSGAPRWDASERRLTAALPPATIARVRLSCRFRPHDLDKLAVWKWIESEAFDQDDVERLEKIALGGCHWMITPFRLLTLVHAVQKPLQDPAIDSLEPQKLQLGDTFATLAGTVGVDGPSTGKIDLLARWTEPTGYGGEPVSGEAHVCEVMVATQEESSVPWGGRRQEFGDTKYRRVEYHAVATTRFREYFEPGLEASALTRQSPFYTAEVLSSARPLAPNLLYVVPTFGWDVGSDERGAVSRRRGGLRIYLEEPWFSSGDGELLGVVIWPGRSDACTGGQPVGSQPLTPVEVPERMKPYATQWGRDPIWLSGPTQQVPSLGNFTNAVAVELGLTLEETRASGVTVGVAGHAPGHDEDRGLFYCDLDVDAGDSYYPFVRLALVRYQPKSIPGAELSRVVVADFAQLAPDRVAWVAREEHDPRALRITVSGTGYRKNASFDCTSEVEARLERWLGPGEGDVGWVPVSIDPIALENVQALETLGVWEGKLTTPSHGPGARFRVVIEEYEGFSGDVPGAELPEDRFGEGRDRRLVYSDAVEIDPG